MNIFVLYSKSICQNLTKVKLFSRNILNAAERIKIVFEEVKKCRQCFDNLLPLHKKTLAYVKET